MSATIDIALQNLTESDISKLGFSIKEFVAEWDISNLKERIQVRDEKHLAPKERVGEYAERMKTETTPAILITADGVVVDGNTRIEAAKKNKRQFLPAYVLDIDFSTATAKEKDYLSALAAKANRHGQPLDKKEKRIEARKLAAQGWTSDMIGYYLGVVPSVVTQVKHEIAAEDKLAKVGMGSNGNLQGASLRALGMVSEMNDQPFAEIAKLAADAGLNASDIRSLAKEAQSAGSDKAALDIISSEREARVETITELGLTGTVKPPLSRKLRQALGFVVNHAENPSALVEFSDAYIEQHLEVLEKSIATLTAVLAAQKSRA